MLYITQKFPGWENGEQRSTTWHVGQPLPQFTPGVRVIEFQADGDELNLILEALRNYER